MTRSLGICLGASTIKVAELIEDNGTVTVGKTLTRNHESNARREFTDLLGELGAQQYDYAAVTGRKFREMINCPSITEPEAVESALEVLGLKGDRYSAVASLGAESFIVYILDKKGNIGGVTTGNKCASGTGEFFLQQIRRMDISVDQAVALARDSDPYRVSGRCSVFCKSDCTHALNKGLPIGPVTAGLCRMMVEKVLDLLEKVERKDIIAIGGVTRNGVVMDYLARSVTTLLVPDHAGVFEALGAAFHALRKKIVPQFNGPIFLDGKTSFTFLSPISEGEERVRFKEIKRGRAEAGDECIVGLDVGSTTTKAVLLRSRDSAMLASVYLRTNGNPVKASRECYTELIRQIPEGTVVSGLATTGSGRQIAGLHAGTDAIINEIIAHATGAAYFDKEVDTIFEIGGQDAKYTYLTNAVPSDYAMNEACSAGTGSFLEESARESLGVDFRRIEEIAQKGRRPPNFNDQCAAFISSDIKTAAHEGIGRDDIVAGLVYSICMNYVNRVKGQRRIGKKIFMQGGVCYNKAVPLAMANLIERTIIVPPEPGLIGAFGVALELRNRIEHGLSRKKRFDLTELAAREIEYGASFRCAGGTEHCDRGCEISMIVIEGKKYPFGGACNKYYNQVHHLAYDAREFDRVTSRQQILFASPTQPAGRSARGAVGISRSYLTNTLYPLYGEFFRDLGCSIVLSDAVDEEGIKRKRSAFCYPGEIAHGCYLNLVKKAPEYIFLPRVIELHVENAVSHKKEHLSTCLLLQSEPYWLKSAFKDVPVRSRILSPILNFNAGWDAARPAFVDMGSAMGVSRAEADEAYTKALKKQEGFSRSLRDTGTAVLEELARDPTATAVVVFGRSYNAFAKEANMGIPAKFASRGVRVIPWDCLPAENEPCDPDMCWATGQLMMRAASFVKTHPQLYGCFVTNFSCGPDSFLVGYFRDIMKTKPSLTLELDSHTADAGVNTRIEAFLDIVDRYRQLGTSDEPAGEFVASRIVFDKGRPYFISSRQERIDLYDKRVHVLFPSMGDLSSEVLAAAFTGAGIRASALPVYDFDVLKMGRAHSSCKECLPLQLTMGGLLSYLAKRLDSKEYLVYFMPTTAGNCRFTQYSVFLRGLIEKHRIHNVALLSLTTENSYAGMPMRDVLNVLKGIITADVMEDIRNALRVLALDRDGAMAIFDKQWSRILQQYRAERGRGLFRLLGDIASVLRAIPLRYPLREAKTVSLLGEIFVRREHFSCQDLVERLVHKDIVVKRAHIFEWLKYIDHMVLNKVYDPDFTPKTAVEFYSKLVLQNWYERRIKKTLGHSGLYEPEIIDMKRLLDYGKQFFDISFTGETILVAGSFFRDMLHTIHGVISIGPFACMPTRVIEAVLSAESTVAVKRTIDAAVGARGQGTGAVDADMQLPFLSIESDGNPFPQIVEARVEAFCLQVERLHALTRAGASMGHAV